MMQANKAEKLFKELETVIRNQEKDFGVVLPDSTLPASKIVLKGALKSFISHLHHNKEMNGESTARIKAAYTALGRFTVDSDADFVKEYKASMATAGNVGAAEKSKKFQFIMNKIRIQEEDCAQEFKAFFSRLINDKILGEPA